jgi:hypothetical protein
MPNRRSSQSEWFRGHPFSGMNRIVSVDVTQVLAVVGEVRAKLALPDNDYSWSSFGDAEAALSEIDELVAEVQARGKVPFMLRVLFAPTGPIQEVSLSSGWGDEFIALADRFDAAAES